MVTKESRQDMMVGGVLLQDSMDSAGRLLPLPVQHVEGFGDS